MSLLHRDNCGDTYDDSTIGLAGWTGGFRGVVAGRVAGGALRLGQPTIISFDTLAKQGLALGSEFTWHCGFQAEMIPSADAPFLAFTEGATLHVDVRMTPAGTIRVTRNGTTLATGSIVLTAGIWYQLNVHVKVHDTAGEIHTSVDAVTDIAATGLDTRNGGTGSIDGFYIRGTSPSVLFARFDDIHIWSGNDDRGLSRVIGRVAVPDATAAGTYADWTPSVGSDHGALVDDDPPDGDATYLDSATGGNRDSFRMQPLGISLSATIHAVVAGAVARKLDIGPRVLNLFLRIDGTDHDQADQYPSFDYQQLTDAFEVNPDTSSAWSVAEVDALEVGVRDDTP